MGFFKNFITLLCSIVIFLGVAEAVLHVRTNILRKQLHQVQSYEFNYSYRYNSMGFRDEEFRKKKDKGTFRILIFGDSLVEGILKDEDTFDKIIERKCLADGFKCEVFNLGQKGTGPSTYYEVAKQFKGYDPDLVIVSVYVDNDIEKGNEYNNTMWDFLMEKSPEFKKKFLGIYLRYQIKSMLQRSEIFKLIEGYFKGQEEKKRQLRLKSQIMEAKIDPLYKGLLLEDKINPGLFDLGSLSYFHEYYEFIEQLFETAPNFKIYISAIKRIYQDTPVILLINPSKYQVNLKYLDSMRKIGFQFKEDRLLSRRIQDLIVIWAFERGINYLDLHPLMMKSENRDFFYDYDDHYNPRGSNFAMDALYDFLKKNRIAGRKIN